MQFISNSDFPGISLPASRWAEVARPPDRFRPADATPCTRITTRVICKYDAVAMAIAHRNRTCTATVGDEHRVLLSGVDYVVKTAVGVLVYHPAAGGTVAVDDDVQATRRGPPPPPLPPPRVANESPTPSPPPGTERAYWLRRTLRTAIYGNVLYGTVLRRLDPPVVIALPGDSTGRRVDVEWEETHECVAVKEMIWEHIRSQTHRSKLIEDPIREVSAMQYCTKWHRHHRRMQMPMHIVQRMGFGPQAAAAGGGGVSNFGAFPEYSTSAIGGGLGGYRAGVQESSLRNIGRWIGQQCAVPPLQSAAIQSTTVCQDYHHDELCSHVMVQLNLLSDDTYLYSVMPYCDGGEMFDVIERKKRLTEPEARYCMRHLLSALRCLKNAGVCHRDLSLENLLVCKGKIRVIDMGMCLKIPIDDISGRRYLILPQDVCGKWHYMSPEVCENELPFDGPAVDLWAAGVILFLMLTGFPPWERPVLTDDRFKFISSGYLVSILSKWRLGLSGDAMDLLQRMFWLDPTDRLSLDQVCAHPWMSSGLPEYCIVDPF
jgi:serine/threonine protein kinase